MNISANTLLDITRKEEPSKLAYYMAHAYMKRWKFLSQSRPSTRTGRRKQAMKMTFLTEITRRYLRLSDSLTVLEDRLRRGE